MKKINFFIFFEIEGLMTKKEVGNLNIFTLLVVKKLPDLLCD
jgi:hypothetical protein